MNIIIIIFLIFEIKNTVSTGSCNTVINEINPVGESSEQEFIELKIVCSEGGEKRKSLKDHALIIIEYNDKGND